MQRCPYHKHTFRVSNSEINAGSSEVLGEEKGRRCVLPSQCCSNSVYSVLSTKIFVRLPPVWEACSSVTLHPRCRQGTPASPLTRGSVFLVDKTEAIGTLFSLFRETGRGLLAQYKTVVCHFNLDFLKSLLDLKYLFYSIWHKRKFSKS